MGVYAKVTGVFIAWDVFSNRFKQPPDSITNIPIIKIAHPFVPGSSEDVGDRSPAPATPATGLAAPPSHRLLSAIIGQRPRGVTAPGHRPLSVVIGHRPRVFIDCTGHRPRSAPSDRPLSPIIGR